MKKRDKDMCEESQYIYQPQICEKSARIANKTRQSIGPNATQEDTNSSPGGAADQDTSIYNHLYNHG